MTLSPQQAAEWVAQTVAPGRFASVRWLDATASTNADLLIAAKDGADEMALITDFQSAGRGRRDRRWESPSGTSLMMSVLIRHGLAPDRLFLVITAMGLAATDALGEIGVDQARLKWPNDVVVANQKMAGILAEVCLQPTLAVVVGIGVNVSEESVAGLPDGIRTNATCVEAHSWITPDTRCHLAAGMLRGLAAWLGVDHSAVMNEYRRRLATIGQIVTVTDSDGGVIEGTASGVSDTGELIVTTAAGERRISVGDVAHVRPK